MTEDAAEPRSRWEIPAWLEVIGLVAVAIVVALIIKTFFVQLFFVPSGSMMPGLQRNDRILVQKISYWTGDVERGDVIVFEDPNGEWLGDVDGDLNIIQKALNVVGLFPTGGHLVKRVVGVPGDVVQCCDDDGRVSLNGTPLDETAYLQPGVKPSERRFKITVPEDRLWVMGDNRPNSEDSRFHRRLEGNGTIPIDNVVGKVYAVIWPLNRLDRLQDPDVYADLD